LLKFSRSAAAVATRDGVELRMTHEQLAQAVGTARETISLLLHELRNENLIRTGRNRVMFDPRTLTGALAAPQPSSNSTILS
jgi:CRP-like cAMP-binding protein